MNPTTKKAAFYLQAFVFITIDVTLYFVGAIILSLLVGSVWRLLGHQGGSFLILCAGILGGTIMQRLLPCPLISLIYVWIKYIHRPRSP